MKKLIFGIFLWTAVLTMASCTSDQTTSIARSYFYSLESVLEQDAGNLWGISLYAPTFFVDPETRIIYANRSDNEGLLAESGGIWSGTFPEDMNPANSTAQLGGMKWTMALWPLSENDLDRNVLLVHETFHYRQPELGLNPEPGLCTHMDTTSSRTWLKMEWNALDAAIREEDPGKAAEDVLLALQMRNTRLSEFSADARKNEDGFLILEGLPEYTAYKICSENTAMMKEQIIKSCRRHWNNESFVYSFAYHSGLAYGYLLDRFNPGWRTGLGKNASLPDMLHKALLNTIADLPAQTDSDALNKYGYDTIMATEKEREREKARIREAYIDTFTRDTVLLIPLRQINMGFSPVNVQSLGQLGTLYPNIRITGDFGILEVTEGGCLVSQDWSKAVIPYKGTGWNLELKEGYNILPPSAEAPLVYRIAEM